MKLKTLLLFSLLLLMLPVSGQDPVTIKPELEKRARSAPRKLRKDKEALVQYLTGDLETMAALHQADPVTVHRINLGGIHHKAGRRERLPYLYLTDEEMARLEALEAAGAAISAQDLPTTAPVTLKALG